MKKSVALTTTAASIGLATALTLSAVAPSMAKTSSHTNTATSSSAKSATGTGLSFGTTADARKFTSVNFTITNVPSTITDAATVAKLLVVKVAPLAADAWVRFGRNAYCLTIARVTLPVVAVTLGVRSAAVVTVTITGVADCAAMPFALEAAMLR